MQRIIADFNRLGADGPSHENELVIATEDRLKAEGVELCEGAQAVFYEPGSLEAIGTMHSVWDEGWKMTFWFARLDISTLHDID